jgi:hypothetical protein
MPGISDRELALVARDGTPADLDSLSDEELRRLSRIMTREASGPGAGTRKLSEERLARLQATPPIDVPSGPVDIALDAAKTYGGEVVKAGKAIHDLPSRALSGELAETVQQDILGSEIFEGFKRRPILTEALRTRQKEQERIAEERATPGMKPAPPTVLESSLTRAGGIASGTQKTLSFIASSVVPGTNPNLIVASVIEDLGREVARDTINILSKPGTQIEEHTGKALMSAFDATAVTAIGRRVALKGVVRAKRTAEQAAKEAKIARLKRFEAQAKAAQTSPGLPEKLLPGLDETFNKASKALGNNGEVAAASLPTLERTADALGEAANTVQRVSPTTSAAMRTTAERVRVLKGEVAERAGKTVQKNLDDMRAVNAKARKAAKPQEDIIDALPRNDQAGAIRTTALVRLGSGSLGATIGGVAGADKEHPFLGAMAGGVVGLAGAELLLNPSYRATMKRLLSIGTKREEDFEAAVRGIIEPMLPDKRIRLETTAAAGQAVGAGAGAIGGAVLGHEIFDDVGGVVGGLAGIPLGARLGRGAGSLLRDFNPRRTYQRLFTEGGGLSREVQAQRQAMKRKIAGRSQEISDLSDKLNKLNAADQNIVDRYWRGWISPEEMAPGVRKLAEDTRDLIDNLGLDIVEVGIAEGRLAEIILDNTGTYVPRFFLKHEAADDLLTVADHFRSRNIPLKRMSPQHYTKHRKDLPEDVRRAYGELSSEFDQAAPGYVLGKHGQVVSADVEYARYANWIAASPDHVVPQELIEQGGKGLRFSEGPGGARTVEWNGQVYREMGKNKRLGSLRNRFVQEDIAFDLETMHSAASSGAKLLDLGTAFFKIGKVTLNPATLMRNVYSAFILNDVGGGLSPARVDIYGKSIRDLLRRTPRYVEARNAGALGGTFVETEIRSPLRAMQNALRGKKNTLDGAMEWVSKTTELPLKKMQRFHEATEQFQKQSLYNYGRDVLKMGIDDAAEYALRFGYDYRDVSHWIRVGRRSVFGAPFITFSYKALPRMLGGAIAVGDPKRLLQFWKYPLAIGAINEYSTRKHGVAKEGRDLVETLRDVVANGLGFDGGDQAKKYLPSYTGGIQVQLPWRDSRDRLLYFDLTWILPWGDVAEFGKGTLGRFLADMGIPFPRQLEPANPWLLTSVGALTRKDAFTGKPIIRDLSTAPEALLQATKWLSRLWMPQLFPGGFGADKVARSLRGDPGAVGEVPGLPVVAASELGGLRTRSLDVERSRSFRARELEEFIKSGKREIGRLLRAGKKTKAARRQKRFIEQVRKKSEQLGIAVQEEQ